MAQDAIFALIPITALMIPVAAIAGHSFKQMLRFKEKQLEAMGNQTAEKAAQYASQVERLEQRMRVLERIVTDKGIDTADQIEALRTAHLPDPKHDRI